MDTNLLSIKTENLDDNAVKVSAEVKAEEVDRRVRAAYSDFAQKYRFKGFRPGKAPRQVIDRVLGKEAACAQATDSLVNEAYPLILSMTDLVPLGEPAVDAEKLVEEGSDYSFAFTVKVKPACELSSYEPVHIKLPSEEAGDDEVNSQLEVLRSYQYTFRDIEDRDVEAADFLVLNIDAQADGEEVESLCSASRIYQLGSGVLPAAFDEQLVGTKVGEAIQFSLSPEDGLEQETPVDFTVTVKNIREKVYADFDDEFAKKCGAESMEDLRSKIADGIVNQKKASIPRLKEEAVLKEISERVEGEPSEEMLAAAKAELAQQMFMQLQRSGMTLDSYLERMGIEAEQFREDLSKQAKDVATQHLGLDALARHLKLEITDEDLKSEFKDALEGQEENADELLGSWKAEGRLPQLKEAMLREKATEWLKDNAVVETVDVADTAEEQDAQIEDNPADEGDEPAKDDAAEGTQAANDAAEADGEPEGESAE